MGKNKSSVKKVGIVAEKISTATGGIGEIVKNKDNISNLTNDHFKLVIGTVGAIGEAAMPYLPLISSVLTLTAKIVKAYDNAQYNKKSCAALIQRVQSAEVAVKVLDRRKQENQENFHQQTYYINFERFITILGDIEAFMTDFTRLSQYKKFISNNVIKERFIGLINDFDRVVHDLGFTMIIASDEDRKKEIEVLNNDIAEMSKFLQTIEAGVTTIDKKISHVLEHVLILQDKKKDKDFSPPIKKIPPNEIKIESSTHDKKLLKARYLGCNVACDTIILPDDDKPGSHRINAQLAILRNLASCEFIINFHGLTKINGIDRMVVGWAEFSNLKEFYEKNHIKWPLKIRIATNICRGIIFLNGCDIFHHDIRCENILAKNYEPKITNFSYSRDLKDNTIKIENQKKIIRCFGMLLWELAFQQLPYKNMEFSQIQSHVLSGKREHLDFTLDLPEKEFGKIVNSGFYTIDSDNISPILRLEDGLALDKQGQKEKAYECFKAHADIGNKMAKFWLGNYYWRGIVVKKDLDKAAELFKEAADKGVARAQLCYTKILCDEDGPSFDLEEFMKYLRMAADNGNEVAQFNLGDLYYNGKLGVKIDEKRGLEYLKLAALKDQPKAIELLEKLNISNIYQLED
ncbi:13644_t:CDS:2 [Entrophospora sp. SA101]|nr:13644_t:CDS:2 [Entrophospora sp. SA101]